MIPKDAAMLLSFINLKLRDYYPSLDAFCEDTGEDKQDICLLYTSPSPRD